MEREWWYHKNGKDRGPVSETVLRELAAVGELQPKHLVWEDGDANRAQTAEDAGFCCETVQIRHETPSPESQWWYRKDGRDCGPVSEVVLLDLAAVGELAPSDFLWRDGYPKPQPAFTFSWLFPKTTAVCASGTVAKAPVRNPTRQQDSVDESVAFTIVVALLACLGLGVFAGVMVMLQLNSSRDRNRPTPSKAVAREEGLGAARNAKSPRIATAAPKTVSATANATHATQNEAADSPAVEEPLEQEVETPRPNEETAFLPRVEVIRGHEAPVWSVAFSPAGRRVASGSADGTVRVWDSLKGVELLNVKAHPGGVENVSYSPDGTRIASCGNDGFAVIWNALTGIEERRFDHIGKPVHRLVFTPDGGSLITVAERKFIYVWDIEADTMIRLFEAGDKTVHGVAVSPDGESLATGCVTVRLWDHLTDEKRWEVRLPANVSSLAFSPNGKHIAAGCLDKTVWVLNASDGTDACRLTGFRHGVRSVVFSPDGQRLLSGGIGWEVRLWDVTAAKQLSLFWGHSGWVNSVAFHPHASFAASGSDDGTVRLWRLATKEPQEH